MHSPDRIKISFKSPLFCCGLFVLKYLSGPMLKCDSANIFGFEVYQYVRMLNIKS